MISEWDKLINHIKLESSHHSNGAKHRNGDVSNVVTAITVKMLLDCNGQPLIWMVSGESIAPASRAKALLELF